MSAAPANTLSRDHVKRLLASVGTMAAERPVPPYTVHDWMACRFFNDEQMETLQRKATLLEGSVGDLFVQVCQCDFNVTAKEVKQVSGQTLMDDFNRQDSQLRFLALGLEPRTVCGVLALPERTAQLWAKAALGETDAVFQKDAVLSNLETSLLNDLCKRLATSVARMDPLLILACDRGLTTACPVQWPSTESLLVITVSVHNEQGNNETEAMLILPCDCYAPLVGKVCDDQEIPRADVDCRAALKEAIHQLHVPMTAYLGTLSLSFQDLVSLQTSDILVLDKSVHETLDVAISGKKVFQGVPGQHRGQLAVLITDSYTQALNRTCA